MILRTTTISLLIVVIAHAQCPPSRGFFIGTPISITVDEDPGVPLPAGQLLHKARGFLNTPPANTTLGIGPNFDIQAALIKHGATAASPIEIDAISLGIDWVLANDITGEILVPANRWGALSFSVSRGTKGLPGSVIEREANSADGAAADVFTYALPGSAIPSELLSRTQRAIDSREIDMGSGAQRNINAIDHFIPIYGTDPSNAALMPKNPTFYFSVSWNSITKGIVPQSWFGTQVTSGATILKMTWGPPPFGGRNEWSVPTIHLSYRALGLTRRDDVDALALDVDHKRILFSTKNPTLDEILFLKLTNDFGAPIPYMQNGKKVSEKIGTASTDDVDAICAIDPTVRRRPSGPNASYFFMGTPQSPLFFPGHDVHASAFRDDSAGSPAWHSHVTGWPKVTGKGPGFAAFYVSIPAIPWPWIPISVQRRDPLNPFCGDPREEMVKIPANVSLTNIQVKFHWLLADANLTEIAEAHPLIIRL